MGKFLLGLSAAAVMVGSASAMTITMGGVAASDGSGLTTGRSGATVETFDLARISESFKSSVTVNGAGCGTNVVSASGDASMTNGSVGGVRAAPAGDTTCFYSTPDQSSHGSSTITFPGAKGPIDYLGFYWGSMDNYNTLVFLDAKGNTVGSINGADVRAAGAAAGDQMALGSNRYVNIDFGKGEQFSEVRFDSTSYAFEIDNLAFQSVPEPATFAVLGLGALALGAARRRRG